MPVLSWRLNEPKLNGAHFLWFLADIGNKGRTIPNTILEGKISSRMLKNGFLTVGAGFVRMSQGLEADSGSPFWKGVDWVQVFEDIPGYRAGRLRITLDKRPHTGAMVGEAPAIRRKNNRASLGETNSQLYTHH